MEEIDEQINKVITKRSTRKDTETEYSGDLRNTISTGSTLLDLAISGGVVKGGGIPAGILVEIFGPSGSGKTVLLSEIAGGVQRKGGSVMFRDPEARLDKQFARLFGLDAEHMEYDTPDLIPELFSSVRGWEPEGDYVHGIFADSLAALSTKMEMDSEDGDKMGMSRSKQFSEQLRRTCRVLKQKNFLMVCSNQIRTNVNAGMYEQKDMSTGGRAMEFYASLRLRTFKPKKLRKKIKIKRNETTKTIGIETRVTVDKSSVWKPHGEAPITIIFDYGVDDIRENLKFLKTYLGTTTYTLEGESLGKSIDKAIEVVEEHGYAEVLRAAVIDLWHEVDEKFTTNRARKERW